MGCGSRGWQRDPPGGHETPQGGNQRGEAGPGSPGHTQTDTNAFPGLLPVTNSFSSSSGAAAYCHHPLLPPPARGSAVSSPLPPSGPHLGALPSAAPEGAIFGPGQGKGGRLARARPAPSSFAQVRGGGGGLTTPGCPGRRCRCRPLRLAGVTGARRARRGHPLPNLSGGSHRSPPRKQRSLSLFLPKPAPPRLSPRPLRAPPPAEAMEPLRGAALLLLLCAAASAQNGECLSRAPRLAPRLPR